MESFGDTFSHYLLFGDFNSRTKDRADYIAIDECIFQSLNSDELIDEYNSELKSFENTNVFVQRKTIDQSMNNHGYKLIDFAQEENLFILNGRTKGDHTGTVTSKNVSAIDYFICSSSLFHHIEYLTVYEFCPRLSDVHCPVSLYTSFRTETKCTCSKPEYTDIKIWNSNKKDQFEENINQTMLIKILDDISRIPQESQDQVKDINSVIHSIGSLFMEAAEKSFGLLKPISKAKIVW